MSEQLFVTFGKADNEEGGNFSITIDPALVGLDGLNEAHNDLGWWRRNWLWLVGLLVPLALIALITIACKIWPDAFKTTLVLPFLDRQFRLEYYNVWAFVALASIGILASVALFWIGKHYAARWDKNLFNDRKRRDELTKHLVDKVIERVTPLQHRNSNKGVTICVVIRKYDSKAGNGNKAVNQTHNEDGDHPKPPPPPPFSPPPPSPSAPSAAPQEDNKNEPTVSPCGKEHFAYPNGEPSTKDQNQAEWVGCETTTPQPSASFCQQGNHT